MSGRPLARRGCLAEARACRFVHTSRGRGTGVKLVQSKLDVALRRRLRNEDVSEFVLVTWVVGFHDVFLNFLFSHCATGAVLHYFYLLLSGLHFLSNLRITVGDTRNLDTILSESLKFILQITVLGLWVRLRYAKVRLWRASRSHRGLGGWLHWHCHRHHLRGRIHLWCGVLLSYNRLLWLLYYFYWDFFFLQFLFDGGRGMRTAFHLLG